MSKRRLQAWEWENGEIGVRGARTVDEARPLAREYVQAMYLDSEIADRDEHLELLDGEPRIYAVPSAYFSARWADSWGDANRVLKDDSVPTPKGFARVYWWVE